MIVRSASRCKRLFPDRRSSLPYNEDAVDTFEYSVVTRAGPALAWAIYTDWRRWPRFSDMYGAIDWIRGEPWQIGSRLRIRIVKPVSTTVEHVITLCLPPQKLAWIDHAMGTTMEQWVVFEPLPDGDTRVTTAAAFTGLTAFLAGLALKQVLLDFTHTWYDNFRDECDAAAAQQASRAL